MDSAQYLYQYLISIFYVRARGWDSRLAAQNAPSRVSFALIE